MFYLNLFVFFFFLSLFCKGKYPVKPKFPAIGGNECVAEIIEIGGNVKNFKVGDRIIPARTGSGTWTSHALYNATDIMKVPSDVGLVEAATMTVNPCTAYRMLKDFVKLNAGDTVIQNGANSAVGQCVIQLCKIWGINNIGIVRDRPNIKDLKSELTNMGASEILTEEEFRKTGIFKEGKYKKPKLGFNCIGGKSALEIARHLDHAGVHVTYGGMSREPVDIPTGLLIFKDLKFCGYWMTRWANSNLESPERQIMFDELFKLVAAGHLKAPVHELISVNKYKDVLNNALNLKGFTGKKFIFDFTK